MMKAWIALLCLFISITTHSYETKRYQPEDLRKSAKLFIPNDYQDMQGSSLFVLLHGFIDPGIFVNAALPITKFVDSKKLFVIQPYGTRNKLLNRFWNTGEWCCNFFDKDVDDSNYLRNLILEIKQDFPQISKIYILGHSNGAFMAQKMACDHADIINGIVSYAGAGLLKSKDCKQKKNFTFIQINGKKDGLIKFSGMDGLYPSFSENMVKIKSEFACQNKIESRLSLSKFGGMRNVEINEYTNCNYGNRLFSWILPEGKHLTIPGRRSVDKILKTFGL